MKNKRFSKLFQAFIFMFITCLFAAGLAWALSGPADEYITGKWTFRVLPNFEDMGPGSANQRFAATGITQTWRDENKFSASIITKTDSTGITLTATQARCTLIRVRGTTGASTIMTPPATAGYVYMIHNSTTGSNLVAGGITIANNKTAIIANYGGTSTYNRLVADTTP